MTDDKREIVYGPRAQAQLKALYLHIADEASPSIALNFTNGIISHIDRLATFPSIGVASDHLISGLRTISLRRRVTVAFVVDTSIVRIVGIFYGGQDFQNILRQDDEVDRSALPKRPLVTI